METGLR
nr:immunoglobulin heavy chain [Oryctolagus cuniculus]